MLQANGTYDLKDPYYRQLTPAGWWAQQAASEMNVGQM